MSSPVVVSCEMQDLVAFQTYTGGQTIEPSGSPTTIAILSSCATSFVLSDDFEVGDVLELVNTDNMNGATVNDSSNNSFASVATASTVPTSVRTRKISSGNGRTHWTQPV